MIAQTRTNEEIKLIHGHKYTSDRVLNGVMFPPEMESDLSGVKVEFPDNKMGPIPFKLPHNFRDRTCWSLYGWMVKETNES